MRNLLTYGPGIPRYLALWLPLAPLLVVGLARLGVRRGNLAIIVVSTLPTFVLHAIPPWIPYLPRYVFGVAVGGTVVWWLWATTRAAGGSSPEELPSPVGAAATSDVPGRRVGIAGGRRVWVVVGLVLLALALRVPLAWLDPGIGDFAKASDTAVRQLLAGANPWTLPNPYATYGIYQYPAGTLLANVPFVRLLPFSVLGEPYFGARATAWITDAAVVVFLAWAGTRVGSPRGGLAAAFAYAVHPTVVRESGIVVANDLLLALAVVAAAVALTRSRPVLCAVLVGIAVSVKPSAAVLVPLLVVAVGWRAAVLAALPPAALQLPFLVWPRPGLHGVYAMVEPAARVYPEGSMRLSSWYPLYALIGGTPSAVRLTALAGLAASVAAALWAGAQVRRHLRGGVPARLEAVAAGFALPLALAFLTASTQRTNLQDWYLPCLLVAACTAAVAGTRATAAAPEARSGEVGSARPTAPAAAGHPSPVAVRSRFLPRGS